MNSHYSSFRRRIQRVTYLASSLHRVSSNDSFTHGVPNCYPIVDGLFEVARGKKNRFNRLKTCLRLSISEGILLLYQYGVGLSKSIKALRFRYKSLDSL